MCLDSNYKNIISCRKEFINGNLPGFDFWD
jgi:hypothetical protein